MAALTDSRLAKTDEAFGASIKECTRQFEAASDTLSEALKLVVENVKFVRSHWDEAYDRRLREAGFRGAMFLLQEWRIQVEGMILLLRPIVSGFKQTCETATSKGWKDARREAQHHDPVLGSQTRPLCEAVLKFAQFEDQAALTALVFNEYERSVEGPGESVPSKKKGPGQRGR